MRNRARDLVLALLAATSCAYAVAGRTVEMCEQYCEQREPNQEHETVGDLWRGHLGKTHARKRCERNCREGGDLENY